MIRFVCSFVIVACYASPAVADVAPRPPEKGFKRVHHETYLKLGTEIPGYRFFRFHYYRGERKTLEGELHLSTAQAMRMTPSSSSDNLNGIIAVPDQLKLERPATESYTELLNIDDQSKLPRGVLMLWFLRMSSDIEENDPRSVVHNVISLWPDETAGIKFTESDPPGKPRTIAATESPSPPRSATVIAGIALAMAIVSGGIWFFRRKAKS